MKAAPRAAGALLILVSFCALPVDLFAGTSVSVRAGGVRITGSVKSFHEIRQSGVVRQGWDSSCGAAALVTVLRHHLGADVDEPTAVLSMLANTEPEKVRARGGFSLLDLKRFAEALGYEAAGYKGLGLDDLARFGSPVIIPVRVRGFDHFVVFRGEAGGRVLVADPASGNVTMTLDRFREVWPSGIGFVVTDGEGSPERPNLMAPSEMDMMVPDLNYVSRVIKRVRPVPPTRRPGVVLP